MPTIYDFEKNVLHNRAFPSGVFCADDWRYYLRKKGYFLGRESVRKYLKKGVDRGHLTKLGRNLYTADDMGLVPYEPEYSAYALSIADIIVKQFPLIDFSLFELWQLNEFAVHQISNNAVYVAVERDAMTFVFEFLKAKFPGKVLLQPDEELYFRYWADDVIVVTRLVSQRPICNECRWRSKLETLLVDLFASRVLTNTISYAEKCRIVGAALERYLVDRKSLFRYAKRRTTDKRVQEAIDHANKASRLKDGSKYAV